MHEQTRRQRHEGRGQAHGIAFPPPGEVKTDRQDHEERRQHFGPGVGGVLHHGGIHGEDADQRQKAHLAHADQHRNRQAARQKYQQVEEREDELKDLKAILRHAEKERRQHVHHGRARRQQIAVNGRVLGEVVEEEQSSLEMFQPVAAPKGAGIVADDGQHEQRPGQEEYVGGKGAADAQSANQPPGVLGDDDARHAAGRRQAEKCRPSSENVDSPGRQPQQHQGERDGPAELFQAAPTQAAHQEKARRKRTHHKQNERQKQLREEH